MQLPWVSRESYEQLQRAHDAEIARYERAFENDRMRWFTTSKDLLERYHALRLAGGALPLPDVTQPKSTDQADEEAAKENEGITSSLSMLNLDHEW